MDLDDGIDLTFDVEFVDNEFAMDEAFDDDFNVGNVSFSNLLSSVEDFIWREQQNMCPHGVTYKKQTG
jgi:hypothetical protein